MILTGETEILEQKSVSAPLHPSEISHGLTWVRSRAPAVSVKTGKKTKVLIYPVLTDFRESVAC